MKRKPPSNIYNQTQPAGDPRGRNFVSADELRFKTGDIVPVERARQPARSTEGNPAPIIDVAPPKPAVASRSFTSSQGKPQDESRAWIIRTIPYIVVIAVVMLALWGGMWLKLGVAGQDAGLGWISCTALASLGALVMSERSARAHSSAGVERHHTAEDNRTDRVRIRENGATQRHAISEHFETIRRQQDIDHEQWDKQFEAQQRRLLGD